MKSDSIEAYSLPDRVRTYDADMDVMHPLRRKMIDVALEVLPFERARSLRALDLGVGTGVFARRFLERYPSSHLVGVDGAARMLELARSRLGEMAGRVEWVVADFKALPAVLVEPDTFDVVISAFALHHLDTRHKLDLLTSVVRAIQPGGWFLNADLVVAATPEVERRIQEIRVAAVTARAAAGDERFRNRAATRRFLDELEATEQDQPLTLEEDLRLLGQAGLASAEVLWKEYREAVIGGPKTGAAEPWPPSSSQSG